MWVFVLIWVKANRAGDGCHWKDSLVPADPKRRGHAGAAGARLGPRERVAFTGLSPGRSRRGWASRVRMGWFE